MSSFERKMKRNQLKEGHRRLKRQWRQENERRASLTVPLSPEPLPTTSSTSNAGDTDTSSIRMIGTKAMPLLGRPPSLTQYREMLDQALARSQELAKKQKENFLKKREEEEEKLKTEAWE